MKNINRREFLKNGISGGMGMALSMPVLLSPTSRVWGAEAKDKAISIDVGRQLFVDDYLISESSLKRSFHKPRLYEQNPVLRPETPLEMNVGICPVACPFSGGVFYDPKDGLFKIWYHAGWFDGVGYATSEDGLHWQRPVLDVQPGTNRVIPIQEGFKRDGAAVWLDHAAEDAKQRFKMLVYFRAKGWDGGKVYISADGIHWDEKANTSPCGDNTAFYYDPFRKKWIYTIRSYNELGRIRSFREHSDFIKGATWKKEDLVFDWLHADEFDLPDPALGYRTQLYKFGAVAYESLMIGLFGIFKGPPNEICAQKGIPKTIDLTLGFSRNGFHWDRPDRSAFIACSRIPSTWNRGYLHAAGGICLIVGDEIYFYFGAWSGVSPKLGGNLYAGGSTGLAVLRRDGFASLDADRTGGTVLTKLLNFNGRYLFVNAETGGGSLRVESLNEVGQTIRPFSTGDCIPLCADGTKQVVKWKSGKDLSKLAGKPVKFRFSLTNGKLYSFWVSPDKFGASYGYVAAGGPGFNGSTDTVGEHVHS